MIVDLDMRQPKLADAFGISAEQGMSTFLSGNSDIFPRSMRPAWRTCSWLALDPGHRTQRSC